MCLLMPELVTGERPRHAAFRRGDAAIQYCMPAQLQAGRLDGRQVMLSLCSIAKIENCPWLHQQQLMRESFAAWPARQVGRWGFLPLYHS
jgi:hypothetical protein